MLYPIELRAHSRHYRAFPFIHIWEALAMRAGFAERGGTLSQWRIQSCISRLAAVSSGVSAWNAGQYLRFADERTQPCRDLAARVSVAQVHSVVDLGCGPGNSTVVLAERWPAAELTGLDNSPEMLRAAAAAHPEWNWVEGDIATWAAGPAGLHDVVFSNAALQWTPDHAVVLPNLLTHVAAGGALAFQMPAYDGPAHRLLREMAGPVAGDWHTHDIAYYYDVLAPHSSRLDLWETEYQHIMEDHSAIVEWYKSTGLRPYLAALGDGEARERFLADYLTGIERIYPRRPDGRVLFPFRRIFLNRVSLTSPEARDCGSGAAMNSDADLKTRPSDYDRRHFAATPATIRSRLDCVIEVCSAPGASGRAAVSSTVSGRSSGRIVSESPRTTARSIAFSPAAGASSASRISTRFSMRSLRSEGLPVPPEERRFREDTQQRVLLAEPDGQPLLVPQHADLSVRRTTIRQPFCAILDR